MNIYKKIYDDVKDLSKDDILIYLQNNIKYSNIYNIRSYNGNITDIESEQIPDIIKTIVKISPKELIYLLVNKYLRDKKNKIIPKGTKLVNAVMGLNLSYYINKPNKNDQKIDIKLGQRIFGEIHVVSNDENIHICFRTPYKNDFIVLNGDILYLTRNSKMEELLKMLEE